MSNKTPAKLSSNMHDRSGEVAEILTHVPMREWHTELYLHLQQAYEEGFKAGAKTYIPPEPIMPEQGEDRAIEITGVPSENERLEEVGYEAFRAILREIGKAHEAGLTVTPWFSYSTMTINEG